MVDRFQVTWVLLILNTIVSVCCQCLTDTEHYRFGLFSVSYWYWTLLFRFAVSILLILNTIVLVCCQYLTDTEHYRFGFLSVSYWYWTLSFRFVVSILLILNTSVRFVVSILLILNTIVSVCCQYLTDTEHYCFSLLSVSYWYWKLFFGCQPHHDVTNNIKISDNIDKCYHSIYRITSVSD
jgi:hypothetical protein